MHRLFAPEPLKRQRNCHFAGFVGDLAERRQKATDAANAAALAAAFMLQKSAGF
jgi:hypothetical protein